MSDNENASKRARLDPLAGHDQAFEALQAFTKGQQLEAEGENEQALQCYTDLIAKFPFQMTVFALPVKSSELASIPPLPLILSSVHNSMSGHFMDLKDFETARAHATEALKFYPTNAMALINAANIEREHGQLERADQLFRGVLTADLPEWTETFREDRQREQNGRNDDDDEEEEEEEEEEEDHWVDVWVLSPMSKCRLLAQYMVALNMHQVGQYETAVPLLQDMGFKYRLAPRVWDLVNRKRSIPNQTSTSSESSAGTEEVVTASPVTLYRDAIPSFLLNPLMRAFGNESAFYTETQYSAREYYSFWYDVKQKPTNLVEELVQHMLPTTGCQSEIVGAEWWVHCRPRGRNLGHQMHFDTEENTLKLQGQVVHPLVSSVCYLSGEGASPTFVLDQTVFQEEPAKKGWLAEPQRAGFLTFPGDRLHCVLPILGDQKNNKKKSESEDSVASHRITLMIGFWGNDVSKVGERRVLGPCGPVPKASDGVTWPAVISRAENEPVDEAAKEPVRTAVNVRHVSEPWEELPSVDTPMDATGKLIEQDPEYGEAVAYATAEALQEVNQHFFIRSVEVFKDNLLAGCEDEEEDEYDSEDDE